MSRILLSTRDLSDDARAVVPEAAPPPRPVAEEEALNALRAFAAVPAVDLAGVEARVFLTGPAAQVSVRNNQGKLFASLVPETTNPAVECPPEQVLAWVTQRPVTADAAMAEQPALGARPMRRWRAWSNSPGILAALLAIAAAVGYLNFADEKAEGVDFISDQARISSLQARLAGRYAAEQAPGQTVLTVEGGMLRGATLAEGGGEDPLFASGFRLGQRAADGALVLVLSNGAVLEAAADGSLRFGDAIYPRLKAAGAP